MPSKDYRERCRIASKGEMMRLAVDRGRREMEKGRVQVWADWRTLWSENRGGGTDLPTHQRFRLFDSAKGASS